MLDVASGKGELIVRVAERFGGPAGKGVRGVAIDIAPFCCADLRALASRRIPDAEIEVLEMAGAEYHPVFGSFDTVRTRPMSKSVRLKGSRHYSHWSAQITTGTTTKRSSGMRLPVTPTRTRTIPMWQRWLTRVEKSRREYLN